jgi:hypothetical protein
MSRRYKTHIIIISVVLMILFAVGPPAAMASKLPTVCNIFSHKTSEKAEPCGHRAIFSKIQDKSFQVEAVSSFEVDFEIGNFLTIQTNPLSVSFPPESNTQFNPLRC